MTRVLLVDDEPSVLSAFSRLLAQAGFEVVTAKSGREAVERVRAEKLFEVVVSDISMPEMDGLALLRAIREHDLDVPVALMTGSPALETAIKAVEHGAFRYLVKPVEEDALLGVVRDAAKLRRLARLKREALEIVGASGKRLGDRAALEAHFDVALAKVWPAFQPVVQWSARRIVAYEALVRSEEPTLPSPADLFDAAERLGRVPDLSRAIRAAVARSASAAPEEALLFVNVHPADLLDDELYAQSSPLARIARRVVLELTERAALQDVPGIRGRVARIREMGYRIAVDDLGAGYAGLTTFTLLDPEYVKLDMDLVRGIDSSPRKRSVVRAMLRLCEGELGISVISEGVETAAERNALIEEGADLLQGYLFCKPGRGFASAWAGQEIDLCLPTTPSG